MANGERGSDTASERELVARFVRRYRQQVLIIIAVSVLLNLLVFAGSLYMMLIYDSVLPSRSLPTLAGLFILIAIIYLFQAAFEILRSEAFQNIAAGVQTDLFPAIHHALASHSLQRGAPASDGLQLTRDMDSVHGFLSGAGLVAIIDLPWVLLFLGVLFGLHWWLGVAALAGALVLALIAWMNSRSSTEGAQRSAEIIGRRIMTAQAEWRFAEVAAAMGMRQRLLARSAKCENEHVETQKLQGRRTTHYGSAGRTFRLFVQSFILTVGALLVIDDKATGGIIIAASVLSGRALAPVDLAIANWRGLSAARASWSRLTQALTMYPVKQAPRIALAPPSQTLAVRDLWVAAPGQRDPILKGVTFQLVPGQAMAVIGPSSSGKTTLAKALVGILPALRGEVRVDGATYDQWNPQTIGSAIGYVPQSVELIDGTLAENIARFDPDATSEAVIAAAEAAGLHDVILAIPRGYDTAVSSGGSEFSAGQRQRIGLARALYGDPFIVVLDEPNSNLDAHGDQALAKAIHSIRERGGIVILVTHRQSALGAVSHVAVLRDGSLTEFGERNAVLKKLAQGNARALDSQGSIATEPAL